MDFDKVLDKCGAFNRFQFLILGLFGYINFMTSMHFFSQTIISFVPDHWCYHEKLENKTFAEIEKIYSKYHNPQCTKLVDIVDGKGVPGNGQCDRWFYDYEFGYQSITTEMNWVCESAYKSAIGQSFFFVGSVIGTLSFGLISDRFGRLPTVIVSNLAGALGDFSTIFSTSVPTYSACRFISGLAADTNYYMMYIIVLEYLPPNLRTHGLNICTGIFYTAGAVASPWIAIVAGDWKHYLALASLPLSGVILFYFLLPESAQWLVTKNRIEDAIKCLKRVAKFNGKKVEEEVFKEFEEYYAKSREMYEVKSSFLGMLKTPRLRRLTLILLFKSMVITLCYDIVSRNVEGMGTSPFIMFSIGSIAILPASFSVAFLQDRIGRKAMTSGALLVGGIFTTASGIIIAYQRGSPNPVLLPAMKFLARYGVCISFESGAQYATELIPTCVRGQGVAIVHLVGYAFTFFSAYIILLGNYFSPLPSMVLCVLLVTGSFLCLLLPETMDKQLPVTLEEGERFGLGDKLLDFPFLKRKKIYPENEVTNIRKENITITKF